MHVVAENYEQTRETNAVAIIIITIITRGTTTVYNDNNTRDNHSIVSIRIIIHYDSCKPSIITVAELFPSTLVTSNPCYLHVICKHTNLTFNALVYFVILLIARTARIACADKHTRDNYCNPRCACVPRVMENTRMQTLHTI